MAFSGPAVLRAELIVVVTGGTAEARLAFTMVVFIATAVLLTFFVNPRGCVLWGWNQFRTLQTLLPAAWNLEKEPGRRDIIDKVALLLRMLCLPLFDTERVVAGD